MARRGFNTGLDGHLTGPLSERDAEEIAQGIAETYTQAQQKILGDVARRMARGVTGYGWAERKAAEVVAARHDMEVRIARAHRDRESLLSGALGRAAQSGNEKFYQDTRSVLGDVAHVSPNSLKVSYILADLNRSLDAAERRILRQFDDRYADIIATASAKMASGVTNARQAVGEALQAFADNGIDGFIDRAGRHWTLSNYSEMAVLTAIERATIAGYVDTMESYGYELAVIDGHAGSCPICAAWEGVIVSVSGENRDYPSLDEAESAGCFHPRCLHGITTFYEGISHAPAGGFRSEPREIREPDAAYTARSRQRYCERMARKYRDRAIVAQTPQQLMMARNKVREWRAEADRQRELQFQIGEQMSSRRITSWPPGDGGIDAKQLQALSQYAESKGVRLDVNSFKRFEGSPQTVREVIDAIGTITKDFPLLSQQRGGITLRNAYTMDDADYAETRGQNIIINNNAFRNAAALAADYLHCADDRLFVRGTTYRSIGYHEAGHAVVHAYRIPYRVTEGINASEISRYAMDTAQEMIAESFSAHYSGVDTDASLTLFERCVKLVTERK